MTKTIEDRIKAKLREIEHEKNVRIIYACESGSRAWGFPSTDSDYDVRFIYVHPTPWYLGITQKRDVIEVPVDRVLDINGWDIKKVMILLRKSNGPLLEWLTSPVVYSEEPQALKSIKEILPRTFLAKTACWHYLSMARGMMETINFAEQPRIKTYLYALRSVLCCLWIIKMRIQPPVLFKVMVDHPLTDHRVKEQIERLIGKRAKGGEKDTLGRIAGIDAFLTETMAEIEMNVPENTPVPDVEVYDRVFQEILFSVNGRGFQS